MDYSTETYNMPKLNILPYAIRVMTDKSGLWLFLWVIMMALPTSAQTLTVDAEKVVCRIEPLIYGAGAEDVNHEIYGGLYDQKIFGEGFEEPAVAHLEHGKQKKMWKNKIYPKKDRINENNIVSLPSRTDSPGEGVCQRT